MYVDAGADAAQRDALEGIYTGRLGGAALEHFPWAWKQADLVDVRPSRLRSRTSRDVSGSGSATR